MEDKWRRKDRNKERTRAKREGGKGRKEREEERSSGKKEKSNGVRRRKEENERISEGGRDGNRLGGKGV